MRFCYAIKPDEVFGTQTERMKRRKFITLLGSHERTFGQHQTLFDEARLCLAPAILTALPAPEIAEADAAKTRRP